MLKSCLTRFFEKIFLNTLVLRLFFYRKKVQVKSSLFHYRTRVLRGTTVMEGTVTDPMTSIGMYCYIGRYCYITKSTIGNYCSIANNVSIGQGEHVLDQISTSSVFYKDSYETLTTKECTIGNDVWIGVDAIILRGVMVGDGAVVGANSVVTKDIPPFAIVVGSPARIVRFRFPEERINNIIRSEWWKHDIDEARGIIGGLSD